MCLQLCFQLLLALVLVNSELPTIPPLTSSEQLLKSHGFTSETHTVQTPDGYILTMYRLPGKGTPVLMMPGLLLPSDIFTMYNHSLGSRLYQNGNDVWLANVRGLSASRNHATKKPTEPSFWDFSSEEAALQDLPSMIDYILDKTKQPNLNYLGYSAGSFLILHLAASKPEVNSKIKSCIAMSPILSFNKYSFLLPKDGSLLQDINEFMNGMEKENKKEAFPRKDTPKSDLQVRCLDLPEDVQGFCNIGINMVTGSLGDWAPAGASLNMLRALVQFTTNGIAGRFDYGKEKNNQIYKQDTPPQLQWNSINFPIYAIHSSGDELVDAADIETDHKLLPKFSLHHKIENEDFQHIDYISFTSEDNEKDYHKMNDIIKDLINKETSNN